MAKSPAVPRNWLPGLALFLAVVLVYIPVWWAGFIWDDDIVLTGNTVIIGPYGLKEIWTTVAVDICPFTTTTFWFEHAIWGLAPLPYHLVNVQLHGMSAILLWRVLLTMRVPGAWLGAALWAVHPVMVESVAWIAEMKNTESGFFYLLAILFFLKWLETVPVKNGIDWNYVLTLLFSALALASKSSTVILPLVLGLCAWWMNALGQKRLWRVLLPILFMAIAATLVSIWSQGQHIHASPTPWWDRSWPQRFAGAGDAIWFYLGKLLWPYPLMTIYPRWQIDASDVISYLPLLAATLVFGALWLKRKSCGAWFFAYAYFIIALLPALGLADNMIFRFSLVFDHFQYLAAMGPLALAGTGIVWAGDRVASGKQWLPLSIGAAILLTFGLLSWNRATTYESERSLWIDSISKNPDCWEGYNDLGNGWLKDGQTDKAIVLFQKSIAINPKYDVSLNNLGNAYLREGKLDDAVAELLKSLEINPNLSSARENLGVAQVQQGKTAEGIAQLRAALLLDPEYVDAQFNLAMVLLKNGHADEAISHFEKTIELNPDDSGAHYQLGMALVQVGRLDEGIAELQKSLQIDPSLEIARTNLAKAMESKRNKSSAPPR